MITTSQDILYIVIAVSVGVVSVLLCWAIYYVARILGEAYHFIIEARKKLEMLERLMNMIREKLDQSSNYLRLIMDGAIAATQYLRAKKESETEEYQPKKKRADR